MVPHDHYIITSQVSNVYHSYLIDVNYFIILPSLLSARVSLLSFDVIHSSAILGIKIDAIPGKMNTANTILPIIKGIQKATCYESCGELHTTMLIINIII